MTYLNGWRMQLARQMLRQTNRTVAQIAYEVGYGSEAAFSRRFTRHFGLSPSQMRERARLSDEAREITPAFQPLLGGRAGQGAAALLRQRAAANLRDPAKLAPRTGILLNGKRD